MNTAIVLHIRRELGLPDNDQWTNRFQIRSATSNRIYIIAQHKRNRWWGCSCPGWRTRRHCKHLDALNLPGDEIPCEVLLT